MKTEQLKSAEEWLNEVSITVLLDKKEFASLVKNDIEQIQINAIKHGMTLAADIALKEISNDKDLCGFKIIIARDNLTL